MGMKGDMITEEGSAELKAKTIWQGLAMWGEGEIGWKVSITQAEVRKVGTGQFDTNFGHQVFENTTIQDPQNALFGILVLSRPSGRKTSGVETNCSGHSEHPFVTY